MSDTEEQDYKIKRLETLARAREIARQNRLAKTAEKKDIHDKQIKERKEARLKAQREIKEKQEIVRGEKPHEEVETKGQSPLKPPTSSGIEKGQPHEEIDKGAGVIEEEVEEIELPPKRKPPPRKKKKQIIVEESSSSESETEQVIFIKKPRKPKPPPLERTIYRDHHTAGETSGINLTKDFKDYFTL